MENITSELHRGKKLEYITFSITDYCLCIMMLMISVAIGVYFGFYKKQKTTAEYLLGGRNMKVFPVAVSLAASYVSAITLLSMPAEIYSYGTQYATSCLAAFWVCFVIAKVYLPVFYELKVTSSFEYLSMRFDNKVRLMASFLCLFGLFINLPIVMYVPSLAFSIVTGIDIKYTNPVVGLVCIFYTTVGGLRAVVWSDTIQFIAMNGGIFAIILIGVPLEGGLAKIWTTAEQADRIEFLDFDPSFYKRTTFWSMMLGMGTHWVSSMGVNQMCIQRFLSVPSMKDAKKVLYIYCCFIVLIKALCLFTGLIMFSRYSGCDPLAAGVILKADQILPYYVLDTARSIPGLPGIFIAGVFSAALSTMSTQLNTSCGIIYKDFICLLLPFKLSDKVANRIMKCLVVILGVICMSLVFLVGKMGSVLQLTIGFHGLTSGTMLGIFTLGMLSRRVNTKGILSGTFVSFSVLLWIFVSQHRALESKLLTYPKKSFSVEECDPNLNITMHVPDETPHEDPDIIFPVYKISFMWYSLIGFVIMNVVSLVVSYMTAPPDQKYLKPQYFSPVVREYFFGTEVSPDKNQEMKLMNEKSDIQIET